MACVDNSANTQKIIVIKWRLVKSAPDAPEVKIERIYTKTVAWMQSS